MSISSLLTLYIIRQTKYSILDHYTLALEFDCSLLDPGQYFLVFRVGSVSFPVLSSYCGCRVTKLFLPIAYML